MKVNEYGCPFCNEFNGKKHLSFFDNTIGKKYGITKRCVLETKNFVCVPSIGSFVEGYVLIIPKKHFLSILSIPYNYTEELLSIIEILNQFYFDSYQSGFIMFEHGSSLFNNSGGMSVLHAHLHLVPYNTLFISSVISEFDFIKYNNYCDLKNDFSSQNTKMPYLLFKDIDNGIYYCENEKIPSQYFRKKVCDNCGLIGMGDWKEYPFIDNIKKTIATATRYQLQDKYNKKTGGLYGK